VVGHERHVATGTQNQALSALLFFYKDVIGVDIGDLGPVPRAKSSTHVPVVLSVTEVRSVLAALDGVASSWCHSCTAPVSDFRSVSSCE
jgi:hypothetical protein